MRPRVVLSLTLALAGLFVAVDPERALSAGPLVAGHAELAGQCLACHAPFRATPSAACVACHPTDSIGVSRRRPRAEWTPRPALVGLHQSAGASDCLACHTDHAGEDPANATRPFSHQALGSGQRRECGGCHEPDRPDDRLHQEAGAACGDCHAVDAWTPATFEHGILPASRRRECVACHADDHPADRLHADAGNACGSCHAVDAWTPATFEHERYFVLDRDHRASCITCHEERGDYSAYTCYGCHEHTPQGIESEHREEGIADFRDCVRCHRSAEEDERGHERRRDGWRHDD